jgi:hypothetical protein
MSCTSAAKAVSPGAMNAPLKRCSTLLGLSVKSFGAKVKGQKPIMKNRAPPFGAVKEIVGKRMESFDGEG